MRVLYWPITAFFLTCLISFNVFYYIFMHFIYMLLWFKINILIYFIFVYLCDTELLKPLEFLSDKSNGEGNGNPLQCSCLENPRDGGAWWAALYGVAQSRTRLKWLSSNSSSKSNESIFCYVEWDDLWEALKDWGPVDRITNCVIRGLEPPLPLPWAQGKEERPETEFNH